jgi:dodecin
MCLGSAPTWGSWRSERERPLLDLLDESAAIRIRAGLIFVASSVPTTARSAIWRATVRSSNGVGGYIESEETMPESVYKIVELVGTSSESWERAANAAVDRATKSLRDLRIAEIIQLDMHIDGKKRVYRAKVRLSFKYEGE